MKYREVGILREWFGKWKKWVEFYIMTQTNRQHIWIIVPAYNEAAVIFQTVQSLCHAGYQVVVVDDASTDQTAEKLQELPCMILQHPVNLGQGAALETGMQLARKKSAQYVVHFDADGQHDVEDIAALLQPLIAGEVDVSLGSRFLNKKNHKDTPVVRRMLLKAAILVNGLFTGLWLSDAHNGLRAMNNHALNSIRLRENRMAHATEILWEIRKHRLRCVEVPVNIRYSSYARGKGQSSWNALNILADLLFRKLSS